MEQGSFTPPEALPSSLQISTEQITPVDHSRIELSFEEASQLFSREKRRTKSTEKGDASTTQARTTSRITVEGRRYATNLYQQELQVLTGYTATEQADLLINKYKDRILEVQLQVKLAQKAKDSESYDIAQAKLAIFKSIIGKAKYAKAAAEVAVVEDIQSEKKGAAYITRRAKEIKKDRNSKEQKHTEESIQHATPLPALQEIPSESEDLLPTIAEQAIEDGLAAAAAELDVPVETLHAAVEQAAIVQQDRLLQAAERRPLLLRQLGLYFIALLLLIGIGTGIAGYVQREDIKEAVKHHIVAYGEETGQADCVTVANIIEEGLPGTLLNSGTYDFARAMVFGDGSCAAIGATISPGYISMEDIRPAMSDTAPTDSNLSNSTAPDPDTTGISESTNSPLSVAQQLSPGTTPDYGLYTNEFTAPNNTFNSTHEIVETSSEITGSELPAVETAIPPHTPAELSAEAEAALAQVDSYKTAIEFLQTHLSMDNLVPEQTVGPNGFEYTFYRLPPQVGENTYITTALGIGLTTVRGEHMPEGVVAMTISMPENSAVAQLGSHIQYGSEGISSDNTELETVSFAIQIQSQWEGRGFQAFRPTDRITTGGTSIIGSELETGQIAFDTPYICVDDDGNWSLAQFPQLPDTGSCAALIWNFNPGASGEHRLTADPVNGTNLTAHRLETINRTLGAIQRGGRPEVDSPSVIFRQNPSGKRDLVILSNNLAPFAPDIFTNILRSAPIQGELFDEANGIAAGGDQKYALQEGFGGGALQSGEGDKPSFTTLPVTQTSDYHYRITGTPNKTYLFIGPSSASTDIASR